MCTMQKKGDNISLSHYYKSDIRDAVHHLFLSLLATSSRQLGNPTIAPQTVH